MNSKKALFENFKLYAVTDLSGEDPALLEKIGRAYRGGADIVQLRSKTWKDAPLLQVALKIRKLADQYHKLFFVNDRVDLALAAEADGVHLGEEDLPVAAARRLAEKAGTHLWIGKSTHSLDQALKAQKERPDYIGVGPIFETPTKPGCQAVGLDLVREVRQRVKIPFVAIGGIDESNIDQVLAAGAERIAVVRAIFQARDIEEAAQRLRHRIEEKTCQHAEA